jgi:hypothetical protein
MQTVTVSLQLQRSGVLSLYQIWGYIHSAYRLPYSKFINVGNLLKLDDSLLKSGLTFYYKEVNLLLNKFLYKISHIFDTEFAWWIFKYLAQFLLLRFACILPSVHQVRRILLFGLMFFIKLNSYTKRHCEILTLAKRVFRYEVTIFHHTEWHNIQKKIARATQNTSADRGLKPGLRKRTRVCEGDEKRKLGKIWHRKYFVPFHLDERGPNLLILQFLSVRYIAWNCIAWTACKMCHHTVDFRFFSSVTKVNILPLKQWRKQGRYTLFIVKT